MECKNCKKEIDNDSKFCIYCGTKLEKQPLIKKEKKIREIEKVKRKGKESFDVALIALLSSLLFISFVINIILGVNLSKNIGYIEYYKEEARNLSNEKGSIEIEKTKLSKDLESLQLKYNSLESKYNKLLQDNSTIEEQASTNTSAETTFLNKVYNLLNEYSLAINHMNVYHKENWIFNDPNEIALEETFLVKLQELSNKLKSFSYPSSFTNQRNTLVSISEEISHYKMLQIECMKSNDYNCNIANFNSHIASVDKLFNYYNSLVQ